ncbi:MAG TPA: alpha/beta hydrolase [Candidatus Lokiarchaeia archaeon]|nr:alpha/beta hydrolase [Candidatus Lokiarchaeia archaeon]
MDSSTFTFTDADGVEIFVYKWLPDDGNPKAIVQISHGMAEHAGRYERFADVLTNGGYGVYANDHRGHGKTALGEDKQGQLGPNGWDGAVKVMKQLTDTIKQEFPGVPVFLFGHSWGSFMTQNYIERWGSELKGAVLSGTVGKNPLLKLAPMLGKGDIKKNGPNATGGKLENMTVVALNKSFEPAKTPKDWLSRDEAEVEKYIADPFCGKPFPNSFYLDLVNMLLNSWNKKNEQKIPKDLPILLVAGTRDPVGNFTKGVKPLADRYKKYGIKDVTTKFYEGARHETLNETNRDEVMKDFLAWFDAHL